MADVTGRALAGKRVLVAEDEGLLALDLARTLRRAGCEVVGPAARVADALRLLAGGGAVDAAVLDVSLGGEAVVPVAEALAGRGVPVVFLTGYGREALPEPLRGRPVLRKPCRAGALLAALERAISGD